MQYLTRKLPLDPDPKTASTLWYISRRCNQIWNLMVEERQAAFREGKRVDYYSQKKRLPKLKRDDERLKDPASQVLQEVVKSVDSAYRSFYALRKQGDKTVNPPSFRSGRRFFTQTYPQVDKSFRIEGDQLYLAFGKSPKDWLTLTLPQPVAEPVTEVKIVYDDLRRRFDACLTVVVETPPLKTEGYTLYFDPGVKMALTGITSDGRLFEYDQGPLRTVNLSTLKRIDQVTRERDRKRKGSYRWRRLNARIKKLWRKYHTRTRLYLHNLANRILQDHPQAKAFLVGDWRKKETTAETPYRAVQNLTPVGRLVELLNYKSRLRGVRTDRFDERGSTRVCVCCDHVHKDGIDPKVRAFVCEACGFAYPRDWHACLNFLKRFEPAQWRRLAGNLPARSARVTLAPFSLKPQLDIHFQPAS